MTDPSPHLPRTPWDERFAAPDYVYGTDPNDFLASVADRIPPGPVLCLAEGEGRNAVFLAQRGHDVTAVDSSRVGLEKARRLAHACGVPLRTVHADLADFAIEPMAWSGIVAIFAHLPPALRARVHAAAARGLAPGGAFVLEAYTPAQLELRTGGPPTRELLMEAGTLRDELRGLDLEVAREVRRDVHEGRLHNGPSATVQVLGFRPERAAGG